MKTNAHIFDRIYTRKLWGETPAGEGTSGPGSHDESIVGQYVEVFTRIVRDRGIRTVADLGCGDMSVGGRLLGLCDRYIACDVSEVILDRNRRRFSTPTVEFRQLDLSHGGLPQADLACVRQVLQHLSNSDIGAFVKHLNAHKPFRYLLVTEHLTSLEDFVPNLDKPTGKDTRVGFGSGVVLHDMPFSLRYASKDVVLEVNEGLDGDPDAIIRTTLYEF